MLICYIFGKGSSWRRIPKSDIATSEKQMEDFDICTMGRLLKLVVKIQRSQIRCCLPLHFESFYDYGLSWCEVFNVIMSLFFMFRLECVLCQLSRVSMLMGLDFYIHSYRATAAFLMRSSVS